MVGHEDSGASKKKSTDSSNDLPTFNAENLQNNTKIIYYSRTFLSIIGGVIAGILGYTGLTGFVFYFLIMAITSLGLAAKAKFSIHSYFDCWNRLLLDGFLGGLLVIFLPMDEAPGGVQMENEDFLMGLVLPECHLFENSHIASSIPDATVDKSDFHVFFPG